MTTISDVMPVERDRELSALRDAWHEAALGRGGMIIVSGEAGTGKTTLVQHFADRTVEGARVLWGACDPLATPRPLGPLHDIACGPVRRDGTPAARGVAAARHLRGRLRRAARAALAAGRRRPALGRPGHDRPAPFPAPADRVDRLARDRDRPRRRARCRPFGAHAARRRRPLTARAGRSPWRRSAWRASRCSSVTARSIRSGCTRRPEGTRSSSASSSTTAPTTCRRRCATRSSPAPQDLSPGRVGPAASPGLRAGSDPRPPPRAAWHRLPTVALTSTSSASSAAGNAASPFATTSTAWRSRASSHPGPSRRSTAGSSSALESFPTSDPGGALAPRARRRRRGGDPAPFRRGRSRRCAIRGPHAGGGVLRTRPRTRRCRVRRRSGGAARGRRHRVLPDRPSRRRHRRQHAGHARPRGDRRSRRHVDRTTTRSPCTTGTTPNAVRPTHHARAAVDVLAGHRRRRSAMNARCSGTRSRCRRSSRCIPATSTTPDNSSTAPNARRVGSREPTVDVRVKVIDGLLGVCER